MSKHCTMSGRTERNIRASVPDRAPVAVRADEAAKAERVILQPGACERCRVAGAGRGDLEAQAAQPQQERDAEVVVLSPDQEQAPRHGAATAAASACPP